MVCATFIDDSFGSYLAAVRDNLAPDLTVITSGDRHPKPLHINLTRKRPDDDTEIDIFAAEKYFSATTDDSAHPDPTPVKKPTKPLPIPVPTATSALSKSRSLTWTVAGGNCGGSSNSSAVLLRDRRRRAGGGRVFHLGGLGFWCSSCCRKHELNVNENKESASIGQSGSTFVEQKQSTSWSPVSWRIETASPGPWPCPGLTGAVLRRTPQSTPPPKFIAKDQEDARSESSSDLFEIESVAISRAGYEPSEASIAWSVVTASVANVSVTSDRSGEWKGRKKTAGLLLAGCASHKAVDVSAAEMLTPRRAAGDGYDKVGLSAAVVSAEPESSISPVVARYHVDLELGGGSGRIVAGRANGTSWHGGSGRIIL